MPADDGDPVEGVHRDGEPADRRELIGGQVLAGAGPLPLPVVVFGQLRDGLGESQGCLLHRGEQVDVPPGREDGEALRGLAVLHGLANVQVEAEAAAVQLGDADVDQLDEQPVQTGRLRRGGHLAGHRGHGAVGRRTLFVDEQPVVLGRKAHVCSQVRVAGETGQRSMRRITSTASGGNAHPGRPGAAVRVSTACAGKPSRTLRGAWVSRCLTQAPARTIDSAPTVLKSQTMAAGSTTVPRPMWQPWIMAPGPMTTSSSITSSLSGSRCRTAFSRIWTREPMRTGPCESPMIFTPAPMRVFSPMTTSPVISALSNSTVRAPSAGSLSR